VVNRIRSDRNKRLVRAMELVKAAMVATLRNAVKRRDGRKPEEEPATETTTFKMAIAGRKRGTGRD
jgi:hypothetical protein